MAEYQGLSVDIFDEPEWDEPVDIVVAIYIMLKRDMAGVCPMHLKSVASQCRTSVAKLSRVLTKMAKMDKIVVAKNGSHVWLKSGINHSLFKGKCSTTQMVSVVSCLTKWQNSGMFGENFAMDVVQLYASKYSLTIPYPPAEIYPSRSRVRARAHKPEPEPQTDIQTEPEPRLPPITPPDLDMQTPTLQQPVKGQGQVRSDFKNSPKKAEGPEPVRNIVRMDGIIKQAYTNKFAKDLPDEEIKRLIDGNEHFSGFGHAPALLFAISKISQKMNDPIGTLIDFSRDPGKYLQNGADYDEWKRLQRGRDSPAS